jgi:hypothetical protein
LQYLDVPEIEKEHDYNEHLETGKVAGYILPTTNDNVFVFLMRTV